MTMHNIKYIFNNLGTCLGIRTLHQEAQSIIASTITYNTQVGKLNYSTQKMHSQSKIRLFVLKINLP